MPKRVLVVDDDVEIVKLFELYLTMHGFTVFTATSGPQAVRIAGAEYLDVLLCDVRMPDMDGFEVVQAVREMGCTFPICLHTAYDTFDALTRARELDVQDVIFKPSPPGVVLTKLTMALTDHTRAGAC
ncbi:MAG: response regulator [Coriobacteriia bacterium]|nr:response regulator [Coriobacteriia bacterium]